MHVRYQRHWQRSMASLAREDDYSFEFYIPNPHFYGKSTLQSDMFCDFSVVSIHGKMSVKKLDELQGPLKLRD